MILLSVLNSVGDPFMKVSTNPNPMQGFSLMKQDGDYDALTHQSC